MTKFLYLGLLGFSALTSGWGQITFNGGNTTYPITTNTNWGTNSVYVGENTTNNTLNISGGITAEQQYDSYNKLSIGVDPGANSNAVNVSGTNTVLITGRRLYVGEGGSNNSFTISSGAQVTNPDQVWVGFSDTANANSVTVTGTGSSLDTPGLFVGRAGANSSLLVENGASVTAGVLEVGGGVLPSNSSMIVTGTGSTASVTTQLSIGGGGVNLGTLTVENGATFTNMGTTAINPGSTLQVNAGSTLEVNGSKSFQVLFGGHFYLNGGTLKFTDSTVFGWGGSPELTATSTFDTQGNTVDAFTTILGAGGLTKEGSGTLILSGNNTFTGTVTINAGVLALRNSVFTPTSIVNNAELRFDYESAKTLSAAISGTGNVKQQSQTSSVANVTLTGTNTYTGTTTVSNGRLIIGQKVSLYNNDASKWTPSNITVESGAALGVNVGGAGEFTDADIQTLLDGTHLGASTAGTGLKSGARFAIDTTNETSGEFVLSGGIANPNGGSNVLGLTKLGTNTLKMTGVNTFTGGITIVSGAVKADSAAPLGTGPITLASSTASFVYGAAFNDLPAIVSTVQGFAGAMIDTNGFNVSHTSGVSNGANTILTKGGAGSLTFANTASPVSFAGLFVREGTLKIQTASSTVGGNYGLTVGNTAASSAAFELDGVALTRTAVSVSGVANATGNSLKVINGGQLTSTTATLGTSVGAGSTSSSLQVTGAGSKWTNTAFSIARMTNGSLDISAGGQMESTTVVIGGGNVSVPADGNTNTATVSGSSSKWKATGATFILGNLGSGNSLLLSGNGMVELTNTSNSLTVGAGSGSGSNFGSNNKLQVSGANSIFSTLGRLTIGGNLSTGNNVEVRNGGLFQMGDDASLDTVTILTGNFLRLDNGYFAWFGDQTANIDTFLTAGKIQFFNGTWMTATTDDVAFEYFTDDTAAQAFTGGLYGDLGGFTILTSVPEPSVSALLLISGLVGFAAWKRKKLLAQSR